MDKNRRRWHLSLRHLTLIGAFLVPVLIMTIYFAYRHMEPFGSSSLLTVDLGQQYIDFFAYMRRAILQDHSSFFYSFSNALGGEMLGTWAYYLLSPLNWILLFFSGTSLTIGVYFLTVIKYGLAGLSFAWLLLKLSKQTGGKVIAFATMYAMMGWIISNQLNIIWMDAPYLLPLVFYGLYLVINTGKWRTYVIWLTITLIINYYMAYMICLFMILMFIFMAVDKYINWQSLLRQAGRFAWTSIVSGLLAAFFLLPTWWSLSQSKVQYTVKGIAWKFEIFPPNIITKFFSGTFTYDQMQLGMANLFVGAIALLGALFYFTDSRVALRTRITAGIITVFFGLSVCFQPLDLLWHAGQFPVWYPYRFSFVIGFWLIWLAAQTLTNDFKPNWKAITSVLIILAVGILYSTLRLKSLKFLHMGQIWLGIFFIILALVLIIIPIKSKWIYPMLFFVVGTADVSINMVLSLNQMSYVPQSEYGVYTKALQGYVNQIQAKDSSFYRIDKTFMRTKGDALQTNFNGGGIFTSVLPKDTASFYGHIGSVDGAGSVDYTNGSLLTDALLSMKYHIGYNEIKSGAIDITNPLSPSSNRKDLSEYKVISHNERANVYKDESALPLGFVASSKILTLRDKSQDPTKFQGAWLSALTGNRLDKHIFTPQNFSKITFDNVQKQYKVTEATFRKTDKTKQASFTLYFKPETNDAYYLTMGPLMSSKNVTLSLNGKSIVQSAPYRHNVLVSVANHAKGKMQKLTFALQKKSLRLQNFTLYSLNNSEVKAAAEQLQVQPWKLTKHNNRLLSGTVVSKSAGQVLNTSIPYSKGWQVKVNGQKVKTYKTVGMFTAVKLPKGKSTVSFAYWPPLLNMGIIVSLLTLVGLIAESWIVKKKHK
ncbi:YfhO family protein [Levilactobacillus fuyuanensis]|uniref:YfhO family protein n=1 Tax=Levilactobacillus fuyuanensis TaxID=2486022 RepID=A0ABW4H5V7_9LACO|nr:YfhO family protein [Levilactobacillus fuyuanensis]